MSPLIYSTILRCTYIHTYIHTYIRTYMHTRIYISIKICKHTYEQSDIHANVNTCEMRVYIHTCMHTNIQGSLFGATKDPFAGL